MHRAPLLALLAALGGCNGDLPTASFVDKLRVLAVQADPPEVAPGDATTLRALAVEPAQPTVPTAPLSTLWLACRVPPGVTSPLPCGLNAGELDGTALPPACGAATAGELCVLGSDEKVTLTPSVGYLGGDASGTALVTAVVADTGAGAAACLLETARNGGLPVEPDRCVLALKRVTVRDALVPNADGRLEAPNRNPALDRLYLVDEDGRVRSLLDDDAAVPPSTGDTSRHERLTTARAADAAEQRADGTYEALALSWFTTGGAIDGGRATFDPPGCGSQDDCARLPPVSYADTSWTSPTMDRAAGEIDPDGRVRFWAVLRDDRGGVGWIAGAAMIR